MGIFINFSYRPSAGWSPAQISAAERYGEIIDLPFPVVPANASKAQIEATAAAVMNIVLDHAERRNISPRDVVIRNQGEASLTEAMNQQILAAGCRGVAACARAVSPTEREAGAPVFAGFREYDYSEDLTSDILPLPASSKPVFIFLSRYAPNEAMLRAARAEAAYPIRVHTVIPPAVPAQATTQDVTETARNSIREIEAAAGRPLGNNDIVSLTSEPTFFNSANRLLSAMGVKTLTPCLEKGETHRFFAGFRDITRPEVPLREKQTLFSRDESSGTFLDGDSLRYYADILNSHIPRAPVYTGDDER